METFLIDVPMPSMGATVNELTVVALKIQPGARVAKGQKLGELESDKSVFDYESPCDGVVRSIQAHPGEAKPSGSNLLADRDIRFEPGAFEEQGRAGDGGGARPGRLGRGARLDAPGDKAGEGGGARSRQDHGYPGDGTGGRISGDDVARYIEKRKS